MSSIEWETPQDFFDTLNEEFHFTREWINILGVSRQISVSLCHLIFIDWANLYEVPIFFNSSYNILKSENPEDNPPYNDFEYIRNMSFFEMCENHVRNQVEFEKALQKYHNEGKINNKIQGLFKDYLRFPWEENKKEKSTLD